MCAQSTQAKRVNPVLPNPQTWRELPSCCTFYLGNRLFFLTVVLLLLTTEQLQDCLKSITFL